MTDPIPAATVIVVRDGPAGLETLMLRRNGRGQFGGMWVFPGGRIDPEDADPEGDELVTARNAAVREAREEADIVVDADHVWPFSHWTPPDISPKRFATWFFVADTPVGEVTVDGGEIHEHGWLRPADALHHHGAGELQLAPPTWVTLHQLSAYPTVADLVAARPGWVPEHYTTRPIEPSRPSALAWHGDIAYDGGDPDAPGPRHRLVMGDGPWRYERDL
jgi:8-oxo-dGTP pyrophosphatase MutT (NUDIX family)